MARIARVVVPGEPHHLMQRGNRRQRVFFADTDYRLYLDLLAEWGAKAGMEVWAYCLLPNHVHLIAVPAHEDSLRLAIGETHRRYTVAINRRKGWSGHLWQGRFASFPLEGSHLIAAARYIERNPVRAKLVKAAEEWPWSSAAAHLQGRDDALVKVAPLLGMVGDWRELLEAVPEPEELAELGRHERTGRPLGSEPFLTRLEGALGRRLRPAKRGRKPQVAAPVPREGAPAAKG